MLVDCVAWVEDKLLWWLERELLSGERGLLDSSPGVKAGKVAVCWDDGGRSAVREGLGRELTDGRAEGSVFFGAGTDEEVSTVC